MDRLLNKSDLKTVEAVKIKLWKRLFIQTNWTSKNYYNHLFEKTALDYYGIG